MFETGRLLAVLMLLACSSATSNAEQGEGGKAPQFLPVAKPRVVASVPASGAVIAPGELTMSVTFDQPMQPQSYSFVRSSEGAFPDCGRIATLSDDGRTYSMTCKVLANQFYVVLVNQPPYENFKSKAGLSATPYQLHFSTRAR